MLILLRLTLCFPHLGTPSSLCRLSRAFLDIRAEMLVRYLLISVEANGFSRTLICFEEHGSGLRNVTFTLILLRLKHFVVHTWAQLYLYVT